MKIATRFRPATRVLVVSLFLTIVCFGKTNAQLYKQVNPKNDKNSAAPAPRIPPTDSVIEERLVALALRAPQFDASGHQIQIANYKVSSAKKSWFNLLTLSANLNDQTFAAQPVTTGTAYTYPKYFFGLVIPIGTIVSKGSEIKAAKEEVKVAEANREALERTARAEVLSKYLEYKNYRALVVLQSQVVDDIHAGYMQAEKKFNDGSIAIETYNDASRGYSAEMTKLLNLQLQQDLTRLDLERIIGVRLETVIN